MSEEVINTQDAPVASTTAAAFPSISENVRERETFRYDDLGWTAGAPNDPPHAAIPTSALVSAVDPTLTTFAQLGVHRLGASRALISLFDRDRQHIVAEATRKSPLAAKEHHAGRLLEDENADAAPDRDEEEEREPDGFWLCGTAIPRSYGICEHVLQLSLEPQRRNSLPEQLPISVVPDLATDPRFSDRPYVHQAPSHRFYAGVPLRTPGPDGVNIGVYCVFGTRPRPRGLSADEIGFLRDMARTVMSYLDVRASSAQYRSSEKMVKGMGNFVEGLDALAQASSTRRGVMGRGGTTSSHAKGRLSRLVDLTEMGSGGMSGSGVGGGVNAVKKHSVSSMRRKRPESLTKSIGTTAASRQHQQQQQQQQQLDESMRSPGTPNAPHHPLMPPSLMATSFFQDDSSRSSTPRPTSQQSSESSPRPAAVAQVSTADLQRVEAARVFDKAANIIRQSLDVDGVLFLDATVRSFGGLVGQSERKASSVGIENLSYMSNDEEAMGMNTNVNSHGQSGANSEDFCNVLGFATTQQSSIKGDQPPWHFQGMRDRTLQRLLRRYPRGRIFNFEANGEVLQTPASADRDPPTPGMALTPGYPPRRPASPTREWSRDSQDPDDAMLGPTSGLEAMPTLQRRYTVAESIIRLFPGARSVIIMPLWDAQKRRWVAGGFLWTSSPTRTFTTDGTLSFLKVFGLVVMADIYKISLKAEETMKSNILGSISHELRSPLHGLVGAVELLHDSKLDAVQHNVLNIIETSGKTLVDTINHLLDYSKINSFIENDKKDTFLGKVGAEPADQALEQQSTPSQVTAELDCLVEEVVESVLAGFSHERLSGPRATRDVMELRSDTFAGSQMAPPTQSERVQIYLDIEPGKSWRFHTHPGAFRRIVMNLFGNSLKFTKTGFIKISLAQEPVKPYQHNSRASVLLTVSDSGKGISEDYLHNSLFTPFCQEDHFAPGTGLGLSLVRQIAVNIGGEVKVVSQVGRGTTITVSLPLPCAEETPDGEDPTGSMKEIIKLKGRKVLLRGFDSAQQPSEDLRASTNMASQQPPTEVVGRLLESQAHLLHSTCRDWLHMQVLTEEDMARSGGQEQPEFIIHHDSTLSFDAAETIASKESCPVLFVCEATVAMRNFSWNLPDAESRMRTFEFFSPPLGPRKLAKGLVHLLNMRKVAEERGGEPVATTHAAGGRVGLATSREDPEAVTIHEDAQTPTSQPTVDFGSDITLVKSPGTTSVPVQNMEVKATPLPTPPEDEIESIDPVATSSAGEEGPYVLIADDNAINLKILSAYMKKLNRPHVTAVNGLESATMYSRAPHDYCCILTDISMPTMDGLESAQRIREYERAHRLRQTPIIALTGLAGEGVQEDAVASGVDLFLTRPVTLKMLTEALQSFGLS